MSNFNRFQSSPLRDEEAILELYYLKKALLLEFPESTPEQVKFVITTCALRHNPVSAREEFLSGVRTVLKAISGVKV